MKKTVVMIIALVFIAQAGGTLFAGEKAEGGCCRKCGAGCGMERRQGKGPEKLLTRLTKELNLTPEQKDKVAAILKENGEKTRAEMRKARENAVAAREETNKQIEGVLTPEQAQKFVKMQANRKEKTGKRKGPPPPGNEQ